MMKLKNTMLLLFILSICIIFTNVEVLAKNSSTQIQSFEITPLIKTSDYVVGKNYKVTAKATSINNPEYRFWIGNLKTGKWEILKDYSTNNTITWTPTQSGKFRVVVHVRDRKSKVAYEAVKYEDIEVISSAEQRTSIKTTIKNLSIENLSGNSKYIIGNKCKVIASAVSANGPQYKFWVVDVKKGDKKLLKDYSESNNIIWTPTVKGKFGICVYVRDKKSKADYECVEYKDIEVISSDQAITKPKDNPKSAVKTSIKSFSIEALNGNSKYVVGNKYKVIANAASANNPQYRFWVGDLKTGKWKILKDYSETNSITWTPTNKGRFEVSVHVRDKKSKVAYEAVKYNDIDVISNSQSNAEVKDNSDKPIMKTSIKNFSIEALDENSKYIIGNRYKVTANATSTNDPQYRFWVGNLDTGKWKIIKDYSESNSITWIPTEKGRFEVSVHVRDKKSKAAYEAVKYNDIDVEFGVNTQLRKQSQLQTNLVNYLLKSKTNRDSVMERAIKLHEGDESNTCVYFTSEALRRSGLTNLPTYVANTRQLSTKLTSYGWVKCTDYTKLLPGDICFSISGATGYPTHAYTFVSWVKEGDYEWANIVDNQRSRFDGEPLHKRTISHGTNWFDKFQYFMYKPR